VVSRLDQGLVSLTILSVLLTLLAGTVSGWKLLPRALRTDLWICPLCGWIAVIGLLLIRTDYDVFGYAGALLFGLAASMMWHTLKDFGRL
jgi:hypothetical protein